MRRNKKTILGVIITIVLVLAIVLLCIFCRKTKYIVTFNSDGGTSIISQTIKKGNKVIKPADPIKEGYVFIEWTFDGKPYDFNNVVTKSFTLYARYEKVNVDDVIVIFDSDGGSTIASQVLKKGDTVFKPTNPTKEGYEFQYWTLDGIEYLFETKVEQDITLKALWEKVEEKQTQQTKKNTATTKNQTSTQTTTPIQNTTPEKVDTPTQDVSYIVSFDSKGGTSVSNQTVKSGSKATRPTNPSKEGYSLSEWTLNGSTYDFNSAVTADITLKAKWTQNTYTITSTPVDTYSPDVTLHVKENGTTITVKEIRYNDGVLLCKGSNTTVNKNDILGESSFILVLSGGTHVTAILS